MGIRRLIVAVASLLVVLGVSVSLAQQAPEEAAPRPLDPSVVAVRLLLGIGDDTPEDWSGRVAVDKGEIVAIEGVRFRDGDLVAGRDSWKTRSRLIRKAAAQEGRRQESRGQEGGGPETGIAKAASGPRHDRREVVAQRRRRVAQGRRRRHAHGRDRTREVQRTARSAGRWLGRLVLG